MYSRICLVSRLSPASKCLIHQETSKALLRRSPRSAVRALGDGHIHQRSFSSSLSETSSTQIVKRRETSQLRETITSNESKKREISKSIADRKISFSTRAVTNQPLNEECTSSEKKSIGKDQDITVSFDANIDDESMINMKQLDKTNANIRISEENEKTLLELQKNMKEDEIDIIKQSYAHEDDSKNMITLTSSSLSKRIHNSIKRGNWKEAYEVYKMAIDNDTQIDTNVLKSMLLTAKRQNLKVIFDVFKTYMGNLRKDEKPMDIKALNFLIFSFGAKRATRNLSTDDVYKLTNEIQGVIKSLDEDPYQYECLPRFIHSLLQQKKNSSVALKLARYHLKYMSWNKWPVQIDTYEKILILSSYRNQADFPYYKILSALVNEGRFVHPSLVLKILHNQYPFTDLPATTSILRSIQTLHKESITAGHNLDYRVDFGTLEHATFAAARKGSTKMVLLLWDLVELFKYSPSVAMYENAIQCFVMANRQDHNAFSVLADMENNGFTPSRAIISSMNRSIRTSERRIDNAMYILQGNVDETKMTTSSLNCVLSAYASNGLVDKAFAIYDHFTELEIPPNEDTYAYLMESLSVDAMTLIPQNATNITGEWDTEESSIPDSPINGDDYEEWKTSRLVAADVILLTMEDNGFPRNSLIVHQYVRLLCAFGQMEKAKEYIDQIIEGNERGTEGTIISLETFVVLANAFGLDKNMKSAFQTAFLSKRVGYKYGIPRYAMNRLRQLDAMSKQKI